MDRKPRTSLRINRALTKEAHPSVKKLPETLSDKLKPHEIISVAIRYALPQVVNYAKEAGFAATDREECHFPLDETDKQFLAEAVQQTGLDKSALVNACLLYLRRHGVPWKYWREDLRPKHNIRRYSRHFITHFCDRCLRGFMAEQQVGFTCPLCGGQVREVMSE